MNNPEPLVEIWRGSMIESIHFGHAVICDASGDIVRSWGDPEAVIYPRSSAKMIQALPLVTSGAADKFGLTSEQLALACASHSGAAIHTTRVNKWLDQLDLHDSDFRCGTQWPADLPARNDLVKTDNSPCQVHNNCSGKHAGFLTLSQHMGACAEYIEFDHPVQQAALSAFEETTGENSPCYGIDGCSAPNFATTMHGLARSMAWFASAFDRSDRSAFAAQRLATAMMAHPELVAGEGRACTALMRSAPGRIAVKTGAEGVFIGILPEQKLGIAVKIADGATRASECVIAALLVRLGLLEADDPVAKAYANALLLSRKGLNAGMIRPSHSIFQ